MAGRLLVSGIYTTLRAMWSVGDRVKTPMPVNSPKGTGRVTSSVGTVSDIRGGLVEVTMDGSEMKVTWRADTLTRE